MLKRTLFTIVISLVASLAGAATLTENVDRTFDVRPGARLTLSNVNGHVTVRAWDQPRIRVQAEKKVEGNADDVKTVMKDLRIDMTPKNGGLEIVTQNPKETGFSLWNLFSSHNSASVRYEITVPRTMDLDLETVNGGIDISDVRGAIRTETTNGRIDLARCAGRVDASTTNGAINAQLLDVTPDQPMALETTNGHITLSVPKTLRAMIDASTTNGGIHTALPVAAQDTSKHSLRGAINGGGTRLKLRTTNGPIDIVAN